MSKILPTSVQGATRPAAVPFNSGRADSRFRDDMDTRCGEFCWYNRAPVLQHVCALILCCQERTREARIPHPVPPSILLTDSTTVEDQLSELHSDTSRQAMT